METIFCKRNLVHCSVVFALSIPLGVLFAFLVPELSAAYVALLKARVFSMMGVPAGTPLGLRHVLVIIANNLIPVVLGFSFPPAIAAYNLWFAMRNSNHYLNCGGRASKKRLPRELRVNLTAFAFALPFGFGFFVFGIFPAYLLVSGGAALLDLGLMEIVPHAPFEIAALLMSSSVALGIRDSLLARDAPQDAHELRHLLWEFVSSRRMAVSLALVVILVVVGAFVEVYISAPLARAV